MNRQLMATAVLLLFAVSARAEEPGSVVLAQAERFCFACHGTSKQQAEINIESLLAAPGGLAASPDTLTLLLRAVREGEMPPRAAKSQPTAKERAALVAALSALLTEAERVQADDPGPVVIPRLTREEYRHVVRDLTGGIVTDVGRLLPNEGGAGEGFANVGAAQGMSAAQFEKYVEAAKGALLHLRADPANGLVWRPLPRDPVDEPAQARKEAIGDVIAWYVAEQERLGSPHRDELKARLGFAHAAYLEAAWRYRWRKEMGIPGATFNDIARGYDVPLAPVALEKWHAFLSAKSPEPPFVEWAVAWQALPAPMGRDLKQVREACRRIEMGATGSEERLEFGPPYERNWTDPKRRAETLAAAKEGAWPFDIEIGDAKELFLVMTDAGNGADREFGAWRDGRLVFAEGTTKPWQDVAKVVGASSGKPFPFGAEGEVSVKPPGAVKFAVPAGAVRFEVRAVVDRMRNPNASVQAIVLRDAPKRGETGFYPGRAIFGGKDVQFTHTPAAKAKGPTPIEKQLSRRNVATVLRTKVGLNAERNVLADWTRCDVKFLGGPWPDQEAEKPDPLAPYHLTAEQVRRNATPAALADLRTRLDRLAAVAQVPQQKLLASLKRAGWDSAREGVLPPNLPEATETAALVVKVRAAEREQEKLAEPLIATFAQRAWRRPVAAAETAMLMRLYRDSRAAGASFDAAVKGSLLAVLASPHFLYRLPDPAAKSPAGAKVRDLTGLELASRLSFFLWAAGPDEELLRRASDGTLCDPNVLAAQARRMLKDEGAKTLATVFAAQAFRFADFETFTGPDPKRFPEFTPALRQAMLNEVVFFLDDLFRNDRPLTNLLKAEHTFVNADLAKHYGIPGVAGHAMQRVPAPSGRGGLTGMALFLTKHSPPLRTSPVQRGNWILEDLLGRHIVPPPVGVPLLSEDETNEKKETIREQLARHRANPTCAACHNKLDPPGIALEHFDPVGRWRTHDRAGSAVAASAVAHDGATINGPEGLRAYLTGRSDEVFTHINRKLLGYALGRAVQAGDAKLLAQMSATLKTHDYRLAPVVEAVVTSPQFRKVRTNP